MKTSGMTDKDGTAVNIDGRRLYAPQVAAVDKIKAKMQEQQGLSAEQTDAILIQAALTGDWTNTVFGKLDKNDLTQILMIDTAEACPGQSW